MQWSLCMRVCWGVVLNNAVNSVGWLKHAFSCVSLLIRLIFWNIAVFLCKTELGNMNILVWTSRILCSKTKFYLCILKVCIYYLHPNTVLWCGQPYVSVLLMVCVLLVTVFIAWSEPQECRSQCCQHSLWLSFAVQTQLSWQPSGVFLPLAAVSLSFPVNDLWPEGGDGGDPWAAFLPLEEEVASPGREMMLRE